MVLNAEADWAISDISFSPERKQYVDFSDILIHNFIELITPRAKSLPMWLGPVRYLYILIPNQQKMSNIYAKLNKTLKVKLQNLNGYILYICHS